MRASPNCYAVLKHFERCRLKAYPDPKTGGAPWTCGWGETGLDVGPNTVWTQPEADERLTVAVALREDDVNANARVALTQGQFDAFVDALYNIGHGSPAKDGLIRLRSGYPSTFLRLLRASDFHGARDALGAWVSPGTNVEHGLHRRRVADQALWDGMSADEAISLGDAA
jgi:lysozyme